MSRTRANFGKKYNGEQPVDRYQQAINTQRNSTIQHGIQSPEKDIKVESEQETSKTQTSPVQIPLNNLYTAFSMLHTHGKKPSVNEAEHHSVVDYQKEQLRIWEEKKFELKAAAKQAHSDAKKAGIPDAKNTFWTGKPYINHVEHGTIYAGGRKSKTRKGRKKKRKSKTRKEPKKKRKSKTRKGLKKKRKSKTKKA